MKSSIKATVFVLFVCFSRIATASMCDVAKAIPTGQQQIGSGTATADYDGVTTVKGDQRVYLKLTNQNLLGVSYTVTIAQDTIPSNAICTYSAILLPRATVILSGSLFAEPPIGWKTTVSIGSESDAGVLTYILYSAASTSRSSSSKQPGTPMGASR
jgi:hypothetical protein